MLIERFSPVLSPAVHAFNQRLDSGAVSPDFRFPASHLRASPRQEPGGPLEECFVAIDADAVRGCCFLKHQDFIIRGVARSVAQYRLPISEGIIDRRYVGVGGRLVQHALVVQPLLFALGMGSLDNPLPRMLRALGWSLWEVPFYFRACHPSAVVRTLFAQRAAAQPLLGLRAVGGLAGLTLRAIQTLPRYAGLTTDIASQVVRVFTEETDALWRTCANQYAMIAVRGSEQLNALYPPSDPRFIRIVVYENAVIVGWIVVLDTLMHGHRHFGDLRVGSIVDGLALPRHAGVVASVAAKWLETRGVDLIVSNQAHAAWTQAMRAAGLLRGPSNFILACSPALSELLAPFEATRTAVHMTRGDGDGPIHL